MMSRRLRKIFMLPGVVLAFAVTAAFGQGARPADIHIEPVRGNIYMLAGAGGNITVSVGPEGALVVDTGVAQMTEKVIAAIQQLGSTHVPDFRGLPTPIRYVINTTFDPEHMGGNTKNDQSAFLQPVGRVR